MRVGRHTLIWGESLFFGENGIAAGQAPIDFIKADTVPKRRRASCSCRSTRSPAASSSGPACRSSCMISWNGGMTAFPGVGSYFSTTDILDAGGERIIAAPGQFLYRESDEQPGAGRPVRRCPARDDRRGGPGILRAALQRAVPGRGHGGLHRRV